MATNLANQKTGGGCFVPVPQWILQSTQEAFSTGIQKPLGIRKKGRVNEHKDRNSNVASPDDDVTPLKRGRELGLDIFVKHLTIHCALDHPGRIQPVVTQGSDEGLGVPMAKRHVINQALAGRAHPAVLIMLVFRDVSSMKARCGRKLLINGWRRLIQKARSRATSGRACSAARSVFFMRQTEPVQPVSNR